MIIILEPKRGSQSLDKFRHPFSTELLAKQASVSSGGAICECGSSYSKPRVVVASRGIRCCDSGVCLDPIRRGGRLGTDVLSVRS